MTVKVLFANVTGVTKPTSITVSTNHTASTSTAVINCVSHSLEIGDAITVDLGYTDNHAQIFLGYVKRIERRVPDNSYTITAQDVLVRAVDFFVVSDNPETPFKRHNIAAETLVADVLALAGLTDYDYQATNFTFAVTDGVDAEVNLVSAYDYCGNIADILTWSLWADAGGTIHFRNRKPFVMLGTSGQPGDVADTSIATLTNTNFLSFNLVQHEKDLRNRIVIYGAEGINATSSSSTSFDPLPDPGSNVTVLPNGYYKTAVLATPILDSQSEANKTATYNLHLYNKLTYEGSAIALGDPLLVARNVVHVSGVLDLDTDLYILSSEHAWNSNGYICSLQLTK